MILAYAGADWKDNRIPFIAPGKSEIPQEVKARSLFGQVPLLEFDGQSLVQSAAIARYLARKHGLAGKDDLESAKVDEIVDGVRDFYTSFTPAFHEQDEAKKAELVKTHVENAKAKFLSVFNSLAEQNGGHLVGKSLTWADIAAAHSIDNVQRVMKVQLLDGFPALKTLFDDVFSAKGIKEYVARRPDTKI